MAEKVSNIVGRFLKRANKTRAMATEKLIEGGITFTKKQLETLEVLDKKTKTKVKTEHKPRKKH